MKTYQAIYVASVQSLFLSIYLWECLRFAVFVAVEAAVAEAVVEVAVAEVAGAAVAYSSYSVVESAVAAAAVLVDSA